jgi:hypothetical protein
LPFCPVFNVEPRDQPREEMPDRNEKFGNHARGGTFHLHAGVREIRLMASGNLNENWRMPTQERCAMGCALRRLVSKGLVRRCGERGERYEFTLEGKQERLLMYRSGHIPWISDAEKEILRQLDATQVPPTPAPEPFQDEGEDEDEDLFGVHNDDDSFDAD